MTRAGTVYTIPPQFWGAADDAPKALDTGHALFHPAKYGWIWSPTAAPLSGRVFIVIPAASTPTAKLIPETPPSPNAQENANDETGLKIQGVLNDAAKHIKRPGQRPDARQLARLLTNDDKGFCHGYKAESVRQILDGRYPQANKRGLPGIEEWVTRVQPGTKAG
jgi:hypothetical protein